MAKAREVVKKVVEGARGIAVEFVEDESGAALWEYALLVAVSLGIVTVLFLLRDRIREVFVEARQNLEW